MSRKEFSTAQRSENNILTPIVREVQSQQHAFRMNIMFVIILRHVETGEYHYFIPDQNDKT